MHFKQVLAALLILIVLGAGFGYWASRSGTFGAPQEVHILMGTTTPEGDYVYIEDEPYYMIDAYYPAKTALSGAADQKARLTIEQGLADRIAEFKQNGNFAELTAEDAAIQGLGGERKYALAMEYQSFESPNYVSYVYSVYEDTLGAHPNGYYLTFVFDRAGNRVTIGEVLAPNPNGLAELSLLASNQVVAEYRARVGVEDTTGMLFEEGLAPTVENYSNFYVDGETLVVLFPPYQVAAYAAGSFEARVPLADIAR